MTPADLDLQSASFDSLSDQSEAWLNAADEPESPQEINDRRARLENAEALRHARSL